MTGTCRGCRGPLEPGFIEDSGDSSKGFIRWIAGPLEKGVLGGARRFGKTRIDVLVYRCRACGLLALYADGSPELTDDMRVRNSPQEAGGFEPPAPSPFGPDGQGPQPQD